MAGEIFISYRRADQAWARRLHELLKTEGVDAWYDAHVGAGEDWRITTAQALEDCRIFVLLFSANAAASTDIAKELAAATLEKKMIVPVRLENIAPKGAFLYELASRNWINAYDDTEAKLAELAKRLAHVVKTGARDDHLLPHDRLQHKASRRKYILAGAALVLLAATAVAAWLLWPKPQWTVTSSRPFISTLALEDYPAFAPNGATLAYSSGADGAKRQIYVRNLNAGEGVKVAADDYDDISPAWSSDGARLAYVAIKPGEPCHIMVATVPAGPVREVGRCAQAPGSLLTWQPGTALLYGVEYSGLKGAVIFRLNLDTGARDIIVAEPAKRDIISNLHCSPDGKWLAYVLQGRRIILHDLATGVEKDLGEVSRRGEWYPLLAWTQDSTALLVGVTGDVGGSEIIAHPLDGTTPYTVYTTALKISNFAMGGSLLALTTDISRISLARATATPTAAPDLMDPANGFTWSPTFAPDGTLAFLSNRTGTNALWVMKPGSAATMLYDAGMLGLSHVRFSPDGSQLLVTSQTPRAVTIRVMTRGGATVKTFDTPSLGLGLPTWMPDGKAVLLFDRHALRTMRVPIQDPGHATPFAPPHWVGIAVRPQGIFATRADKPGIWKIDGGVRQISAIYPAFYYPPLAFRGDAVLVPDFTSGEPPRILAQPLSGPGKVIAYAPGAGKDFGSQSDFAVNPVTGAIIYTSLVQHDTNIDLLTVVHR